ncbi:carbohydrate binding domain-containing protein [Pseudomonas poae]|uniref:carbohydrate binding domain-containing protein n=1 Tax=Pseudomonas TaxID=286 RepID=UPI0002AF5031|nr:MULTISPECIES: carbohydrate binding domain-containing protein [Pseudomonas]KTC37705.1 hypothetical protein AO260_07395 [Pseudomonas sp. ABAC21]AGE26642.1 hypothetical protein H045_12885 [Pseudomonas poae RE*1-1-14]MCF5778015.1 hypothetical protein [Pseudomonas poae]NMZ48380.1 hypothetical protein [Pseudomonas poae]CRM53139.1 Carbohydrate binding domain protein [Pseudomonas sp. 25 E 4]
MINKQLTSKSGIKCDQKPAQLNSPEITKVMTIRSTVTRVCEVITDLHFSVPVALSRPEVPEAVDDVLTLRGDEGSVAVVVKKWDFLKAGQSGWLEVTGLLEDGTAHTVKLMEGEPLTDSDEKEGVSRPLLRKELNKFPNKAELTVVFRTTVDACCEDGPVITFPESKYTLRKYYRDLTDFNDRTFGRWERGPGAPDPRDLTFESLGVASDGNEQYSVKNFTNTGKNLGVILHREFDDLESGTTYAFSARVRRYNTSDPTPKLSLKADNVAITSIEVLTDPNTWVTLAGTFVASSNFALLVLHSHERDPGIAGNDYLIDYLLVEEV